MTPVKVTKTRTNSKWVKPRHDEIKLNFDGAVNSDGIATFGFILRDKNGEPVHIDGGFLGKRSILMPEALALREGIIEAIRRGIPHLKIEGDNLQQIKAVQGDWSRPWEVDLVRTDIQSLLGCFQSWDIAHVFREANSTADCIARVFRGVSSLPVDSIPTLRSLIRKDALG